MFAALIIGHHFSISFLWNARTPPGVRCSSDGISRPRSENSRLTFGSMRALTTAPLSLAMISLRVPLGAHKPCHQGMWRPGTPTSSMIGTLGAANQRALAITQKRQCRRCLGTHEIDVPGHQILICRAAAAIEHELEPGAGEVLEVDTADVCRAAGADARSGCSIWIRLQPRDQLRDIFRRESNCCD